MKDLFWHFGSDKASDMVPRKVIDGQCVSWEWKNG